MHARHLPVLHRWVFPFYFYVLDVDDLPELSRKVKGFGFNKWRPVSLRESDYLHGQGSFRERLAPFVNLDQVDRILLVTMARFMAKVFNPVSFYYALRKDGSPVGIIAEVNNTFGERHLYRLDGGETFPLECRHEKTFHVSPFNDMDGHYDFRFSAPGESMKIEITLVREGRAVLDAALWGTGKPLTTSSLWKTIARFPFTAALTIPRILWQAVLLRYKMKLPVCKKPSPSSPMTRKVGS